MNRYLLGIFALSILPAFAFAEENISNFDDGTTVSKTIVREYKTEKSPTVVYRQKDTPLNVVINKYRVEAPKNVNVNRFYVNPNEDMPLLTEDKEKSGAYKEQKKEVANKDIRDGRFYLGLNGDVSFLSWENEYTGLESGSDRYTFRPVFGADVVAGYKFNKNWRVDGEFGYIGKFSDKETETVAGYNVQKTEFNLQAYYTDLNAYCDIAYGLYAGLGAGLAVVKLSADDSAVPGASETNLSPMGALMFGWTHALDEKIDLDLRYRFSVFDAGNLNIGGVNVDTGMVLNNSLSLGIKYYF